MKKLYVICNSHMDPIWVWRLREGRATWANTCRVAVAMLKEYPFLKFTRSSSACYEWLEENAPALFDEIAKLVSAGRWEVTGGWVEQSDTIVTPAEALLQQAAHAKEYFRRRFGVEVKTAYSVDSFGQNAGLPALLAASGYRNYCWMRPMKHEKAMPDKFRWAIPGTRQSILSFRIQEAYTTSGITYDEQLMRERMERHVAKDAPQSFFFGLGDHGGGINHKNLRILLKLGEEIPLEFCTLDEYFAVLDRERNLPVLSGEFTHHSPGCYAAVHDIKQWMSDAEKLLFKAEKITLETGDRAGAAKLSEAWHENLFNYFHDIYSGTAIKPAYDHEARDLAGHAAWQASKVLEGNLQHLAVQADTQFLTEGGVMLWNPLPRSACAVCGYFAFRDPNGVGSDFNAFRDAEGNYLPLQWVQGHANIFGRRNSALVIAPLAASGLKVLAYARLPEGHRPFPALGAARQLAALKRLSFVALEDPNDTWAHNARALGKPSRAKVRQLGKPEIHQDGPLMSELRVKYAFRKSAFTLSIFAYAGIEALQVRVAGDWMEPETDLKLSLATRVRQGVIISGQAGVLLERRPDDCEQPFIDWCAAMGGKSMSGFAAADLHGYDSVGSDELRLTLLRPVFYAEHVPEPALGDEGRADYGPFVREAWLILDRPKDAAAFDAMARERLWAPEHYEITKAGDGSSLRRDQWSLLPADAPVMVLAQRLLPDGAVQFDLAALADTRVSLRRNGAEVRRLVLHKDEARVVKIASK
ncbi:MAG: hypothetical protein J6Y80_01645 [Victivallales bacterium]|nr:hypothetical protein [Victivallales bacterium]